MARNCIRSIGWIHREIEEIKAKNVIVFAGRANDCCLARLFLNDPEGKMISKFDYSASTLPREVQRKRRGRDLFVHLRDGERRFIVQANDDREQSN